MPLYLVRGLLVAAALLAPAISSPAELAAADLYIAANGDDANPGSRELPWKSIAKAVSLATPGQTIVVRGGQFPFSATLRAEGSGTKEKPIALVAYPGEIPVLDFSAMDKRGPGIELAGNHWRVQGLEIKGAGSNGMLITGNDNSIERCDFHHNRDTGLQLSRGASNNRAVWCDSHHNADPAANFANADGFAPKLTVGTGNYFFGCRAWLNCDDGWDGYMRGATDVTTTIECCLAWRNGYLEDGTDPGPQANGNGFKLGGGDRGNEDGLTHHAVLRHCVAFDNKSKGFDQNNNVGSMTIVRCTGFRNGAANFWIPKPLANGQSAVVQDCISLEGTVRLAEFVTQSGNSWQLPERTNASSFLSLDPISATGARQADGRFSTTNFLRPRPDGPLRGLGADWTK